MTRNLAALGALAIAIVSWIALAWPASGPDEAEPVTGVAEAPALPAPAAPQPSAAGAVAPVAVAAPAPAEPAAPVVEPPQPEAADPNDRIRGDQGPVEEYRKRFASEPRDSAAPEFEAHIQKAFLDSSADAPDLFKSVICRESICKVEVMWSPDRLRPYVASITRIGVGGEHGAVPRSKYAFDQPLAVSPVGPKDADGVRLVEVYLKRGTARKSSEHDGHGHGHGHGSAR